MHARLRSWFLGLSMAGAVALAAAGAPATAAAASAPATRGTATYSALHHHMWGHHHHERSGSTDRDRSGGRQSSGRRAAGPAGTRSGNGIHSQKGHGQRPGSAGSGTGNTEAGGGSTGTGPGAGTATGTSSGSGAGSSGSGNLQVGGTIDGYTIVGKIDLTATAYGPTLQDNYPYGPVDAFGKPLVPGDVAVDPSVIPLNTHLYVTGYSTPYLPKGGELAVARDTGGAIKGNRIDMFINGTEAQVNSFGIQHVVAYILK